MPSPVLGRLKVGQHLNSNLTLSSFPRQMFFCKIVLSMKCHTVASYGDDHAVHSAPPAPSIPWSGLWRKTFFFLSLTPTYYNSDAVRPPGSSHNRQE